MEIDLEAFKTEAQDAQDAREHFSKDRTSKAFALISLVGFLIYCFFVMCCILSIIFIIIYLFIIHDDICV